MVSFRSSYLLLFMTLFSGMVVGVGMIPNADAKREDAADNAGWVALGVGSVSGNIGNADVQEIKPTLAVAADGNPIVAWEDDSSSDYEIYVKRWNGSSWVEMGNGSASGGGISNNRGNSINPSLAVAADGTPIIAWSDDSGGDNEIYVKRWNGSNWVAMGTGSASGGGISNIGASYDPSVAIGPDNMPIVAWEGSTSIDWEIYIRRWNGSVWEEIGSGSASNGGISDDESDSFDPSVAIYSNGAPIVAWEGYDSSEIYVRRWNGSAWVEIGSDSAKGGGISNTTGASYNPSIAVAPDGNPIVAWEERNETDEIYIRRWSGSAWVEMGTGSASTGGISNNTGGSYQPSLAVTLDGTSIVAWADGSGAGDYEIYVRRWNGSIWVELDDGSASEGGVSNNDGSSFEPSLAVTIEGKPIVAWIDESNGNEAIFVSHKPPVTEPCYTLSVNTVGQGTVSVSPLESCYNSGAKVTLTASPNANNVFSGWGGDITGSTNPYLLTMNSNKSVSANFSPQSTCFTLSVSITGLGNVSVSPLESCYTSGMQVMLTALPSANNIFSGWGGDIFGTTNPYLLTMNSNKSVSATFIPQPPTCYTLSRSHTGNGRNPTTNPTNSAGCDTNQYKAGESIALTAAPNAGWRVKNWSGTNANNSTATTNSVSMPAANHSVGVVYEVIPVTVNRVYNPVIMTMPGGPTCFAGPDEREPNNSRNEANGPFCSPGNYRGLPRDGNDYFSFDAAAGRILVVMTGHVGEGLQLSLLREGVSNPVVRDYDPAGGWRLDYPGTPGRYYIRIYAATPKPGSAQQYTLQVTYPAGN